MVIELHPGRLDEGATATLVAAVNAAVAAGAAVLVDLEPEPLGLSDEVPRCESRCGRDHWESSVATMVGPGLVELAAGDEPWLLDVVGRRLSRVRAQDRRFLPPSAWLSVRAVTVSAAIVGATTAAGDRLVVYRSS